MLLVICSILTLVGARKTVPKTSANHQYVPPVTYHAYAHGVGEPGHGFLKDHQPPKYRLGFDPLYPEPQKTSTWEDHFVKDDKQDGGRWDTQMLYDTIRTTRHLQAKKLKDALAAEKLAEQALDKAKVKAAKSKANFKKAKAAADKQASATDKQSKVVEKQHSELKKAQQNLAAAKKMVEEAKDELTEAKAVLKEVKATEHKKQEQLKKKLETMNDRASAKEKELRAKLEKTQDVADHLDSLEDKADKEEEEHDEAKAKYEAALREEKQVEAELKIATDRLRRWRNGDKSVLDEVNEERKAEEGDFEEIKSAKSAKHSSAGRMVPSMLVISAALLTRF